VKEFKGEMMVPGQEHILAPGVRGYLIGKGA
jgi:hypothetical protein